jgi:hypothetical protein
MSRAKSNMVAQNPYVTYYVNQVGSGLPVYAGVPGQRGRGFGQVLGSLFRSAVPLLKRGAVALGKKALSTGAQVISDVASGENIKSSLKRRAQEQVQSTLENLDQGNTPAKQCKSLPSQTAPSAARSRAPKKHKRKRAPRISDRSRDVFDE